MESKLNHKKINIGILLGCLICLFFISQINQQTSLEIIDYNYESDVKTSLDPIHDLSGSPIYIDNTNLSNNWAAFQATYVWCTGDGSSIDPYTISQVLIDGPNTTLITIKNSDVYFSITWCDLLNGYQAIYLDNVTNGSILYNDCSGGSTGIYIDSNSNFNNISNNIVNYNNIGGIYLSGSSHNYIADNIVSYNGHFGIKLSGTSDENIVSKNTLTLNRISNVNYDYSPTGIAIYGCADNFLSENTIRDHSYSLHVMLSDNDTITENIFYDSIWLDIAYNTTLSKNLLYGSGSYYESIKLQITDSCTIIENTLNFFAGFDLQFNSDNNSFIGNILNDPMIAFNFESSSYNKIINNYMYRAHQCFRERGDCIGNIFEGNYCQEGIFFPLDIIGALIGIIAVVGVTIFMYLKRRKYMH